MDSPEFETCPLRSKLIAALCEGLSVAKLSANNDPSLTNKEAVEIRLVQSDSTLMEEYQRVAARRAANCAGIRATGECCQFDRFQDEIKNFGQPPSEQ